MVSWGSTRDRAQPVSRGNQLNLLFASIQNAKTFISVYTLYILKILKVYNYIVGNKFTHKHPDSSLPMINVMSAIKLTTLCVAYVNYFI